MLDMLTPCIFRRTARYLWAVKLFALQRLIFRPCQSCPPRLSHAQLKLAWRLTARPVPIGRRIGGIDPDLLTRRRKDAEGAERNVVKRPYAKLSSYRRAILVGAMIVVNATMGGINMMTETGNVGGPAVQNTDPLDDGTTTETPSIEAGEIDH